MAIPENPKLSNTVAGQSTSNIMQYRGHINILKSKFRGAAFNADPVNTTIYENSTVAKIDITNTKHAVRNVNYIAKKAEERGNEEGQSILEKFSQNHYAESIRENINGTLSAPYRAFVDYAEFEAAKPASVKEAELIAQTEDEQAALDKRVLSDNIQTRNQEASTNMLKRCIPCEFRATKFKTKLALEWLNPLDEFKKKWNDLIKLLKSLKLNTGEFGKDICNLFKFLDAQCIPDIIGLLSLLSLMQLKYLDMSQTTMLNILSQLIGPLLSPIVGSFTSNLDKYIDLIISPLKCVVRALEANIIEVETQINGALNIASKNTTKYRQNEIDFLDAKAKALRNRQRVIAKEIQTASRTQEMQGRGSRIDRHIDTKLVKGGFTLPTISTTTVTLQEENDNIDKELDRLQELKNKKITDIKQSGPIFGVPQSAVGRVNLQNSTIGTSTTRAATKALNDVSDKYKSVIHDLLNAINDGIGIVKQSIDVYRDEFQRLILGRISTQEDQIEFMRQLQKISRLVSIVKAVQDFKKAGLSIKKFCKQGEDNALAQIAKQLKTDASAGNYDFYKGTDEDGNPLMIVVPGGAKVLVSGIDFESIGDDELRNGTIDLDSVKKTVSFNDLNEVDKLNRQGIIPDLGNLDSKIIELDNGFKPGSELDLHFKTSYAIISNEFCSKSAISFGSSDTVKKWAETLWQEK